MTSAARQPSAAGVSVLRQLAPRPAQALELQRLLGNRLASRVVARWSKHPDDGKPGVMVPDVVAAELMRVSPPQSSD